MQSGTTPVHDRHPFVHTVSMGSVGVSSLFCEVVEAVCNAAEIDISKTGMVKRCLFFNLTASLNISCADTRWCSALYTVMAGRSRKLAISAPPYFEGM